MASPHDARVTRESGGTRVTRESGVSSVTSPTSPTRWTGMSRNSRVPSRSGVSSVSSWAGSLSAGVSHESSVTGYTSLSTRTHGVSPEPGMSAWSSGVWTCKSGVTTSSGISY